MSALGVRSPIPRPRRYLVLPGWRQSAAHWSPVSRWLSRERATTAVADFGSMIASCTAQRGTVERLLEIREKVIEHAVRTRASLVIGHSAGAPLAVLAAGGTPHIRGVVLVEPVAAHFMAAADRPRAERSGDLSALAGMREVGEYPLASADTIRAIEARGPSAGPAVGTGAPPREGDPRRAILIANALGCTRVPVLIVRGQRSGLVSEADVTALAGMGKTTRVVEIAGSGHSPHIDRPREMSESLLRFDELSTRADAERKRTTEWTT